jgi:hypothetical protein
MTRSIVVFLAAAALFGANAAFAQETSNPGPGLVEVTAIPGGGTFFTSKDNSPEFGDYTLGGTVAYNINRIIGIEGEVGANIGVDQSLDFGGVNEDRKSPTMLNYTGNIVVSVPTRSSVVPYATGGVGGMSMFEREELGINDTETFLTGNAGGGVKWYAASGKWGLRGDYRFMVVKSKDDAPAFLGAETRYGHRVYGGVVITAFR